MAIANRDTRVVLLSVALCVLSYCNNYVTAQTINLKLYSHQSHPNLTLNSLRLPSQLVRNLGLRISNDFENKVLQGRYSFRKRELLTKALLHAAYEDKKRGQQKDSYEPLDTIGNMVLEYMVSRAFIMNSVDLSGSNFNKMTSAILNKHAVAFIAVKNKLDEFLLLAEKDKSPSSNLAKFKALIQNYSNYQAMVKPIKEEKIKIVVGDFVPKMMKALIGAVYADSGFDIQKTDDVIMPMFKSEIEVVYNKVTNNVEVM